VLLWPVLEATDGQAFLRKCMPGRFDGDVEIIQAVLTLRETAFSLDMRPPLSNPGVAF
jgi:hypothetical protein